MKKLKTLALAVLGVAFIGLFFGPSDRARDSADQTGAEVMSRDTLETILRGASSTAVRAKLGTPETTQRSGDREYWYYRGVSRDSVTGKIDRSVQVVFESDKVRSVNFH